WRASAEERRGGGNERGFTRGAAGLAYIRRGDRATKPEDRGVTSKCVGGPIRVLIVDDDRPVRDAVEAIVGGTPGCDVVGCLRNADGLVDAVVRLRPDVV